VNLNLSWVYRHQMSGLVFEIPLPRECIILIGLLIEVFFGASKVIDSYYCF
jgi:hypothetical protein